jgi:DNA-binding NarL/FixJ family response regulator
MIFQVGNTKIYLVDDHDNFRAGLRRLIEHAEPFEVIGEAANGRDALSAFKKLRPDVVIVDLEMPELDGPSLIRLMKDANNEAKILVLSQASEDRRLRQLIEVGIDAHVLKVEESAEILKALRSLTRGEKYFSSRVGSSFYDLLAAAGKPSDEEPPLVSVREMQVARLVADGHTNKQVAHLLGCSENTVKSHKTNIMRKIGVHNSAGIGAWVARLSVKN